MANKLSSNIWKFYLLKALSIPFIVPIRILYLLSFGLSFAQIGFMELAAAIVIIILEIPTGVFADIIGCKNSRLIAYLLSILAFSLMSFGSTATIFIIGWAISGAADAFESGAQDALIFDTLKQLDREKDYLQLKSRFLLISTVSIIFGSIIGAQAYNLDHRLPWYLITLTIIISTLIFLTIKEPLNKSQSQSFRPQITQYFQSFKQSLSNLFVRQILILSIILTLPMYVFTTLLSQPYLTSRGFSVTSLGIVFAFITGISGLIAGFSDKIESKLKKRFAFLLVFISFSILLISLGLTKNQMAVIFVVGFYIIDNFKNIIIDNYLNQSISSDSRATILSLQSFLNNIVISVSFVFVGYFVDVFSISTVLISMGILIGVFGIFYLSFSKSRA